MTNTIKKLAAIAALGFVLQPSIAQASLISVNYQVSNSGYESLTGSFSGYDNNSDGLLSFSELTSWFTGYTPNASLAMLNDIGSFNYKNNKWTPNAKEWNQITPVAYMTWKNWTHSMSTSNYSWNVSTSVAPVPEPETYALMGLGLLGLLATRRRKNK